MTAILAGGEDIPRSLPVADDTGLSWVTDKTSCVVKRRRVNFGVRGDAAGSRRKPRACFGFLHLLSMKRKVAIELTPIYQAKRALNHSILDCLSRIC
jgi:hypothetical protein